jgi:hypothetical protein
MYLIKLHIKNIILKIVTLIFLYKNKKVFKGQKLSNFRKNNDFGICSMVSHDFVDMFILNISSFQYFTSMCFPVYLINDGSLTNTDKKKLKDHLNVTIVSTHQSGNKMMVLARKYKNIGRFRFDSKAFILRYKLDAIFTNPFKKFIYLDSDILFFRKPNEIIDWIIRKPNKSLYTAHIPYKMDMFSYNHDWIIHSYRVLYVERFNYSIDPTFNSGMLCVHSSRDIDLKKVDEMFKFLYHDFFAHHFIAEETAMMTLINHLKYKKLPVDKYMNIWCYEEYAKRDVNKLTSMHYAGDTKKIYWGWDVVKLVINTNFFNKKTNK